jgi:tetratricopeptide (TPR) repeat protein
MPDRLEQLHKLHAADPTDTDVTYMIAMEQVKAEDYAAVIDWLDKTLALDPDYLYAYFQKAKAQSALGEDDAAIVTLKRGIEKAQQAGDAKAIDELTVLLASME